jgi:predicted  nucleic acid-binding Zn-ribbon protein
MSYSNLKQEIEIAKELPKQVEVDVAAFDTKIDYLQKEVDRLEKQVDDLEGKVYKR